MSTAHDLTTTAPASPDAPASARIRLAATIGLAGALLGLVAWTFGLTNPSSGTALWRAAGVLGELALVGTTVLVLGLLMARESGPSITGRSFLGLWVLGQTLIVIAGAAYQITGNQDGGLTILFPIGGITAGLAGLIASIFICTNKRLKGSLRRWAPLGYAVGTFVTGFFQGDGHTPQIVVADLANSLLTLMLAAVFFAGVRASTRRVAS